MDPKKTGAFIALLRKEQVKEQTDQVIVQSLRQTDKRAATAVWIAIGSAVVIFLVVLAQETTVLVTPEKSED